MINTFFDNILDHNCYDRHRTTYDCDTCYDSYLGEDIEINHETECYRYNRFVREFIRFKNDNGYEPDHRLTPIKTELEAVNIRNYFRDHIHEELITEAMKPCRIQAQMSQFDNIEDFFVAMGC